MEYFITISAMSSENSKDMWICKNCFKNNDIKCHIDKFSQLQGKCSFCNQENLNIINLNSLIKYIEDCLKKKYAFYKDNIQEKDKIYLMIEKEAGCSTELAKKISNILNLSNSYHQKKDNYLKLLGPYKDTLDEFSFLQFAYRVKHEQRFFLKAEDLAFLEKLSNLMTKNLLPLNINTILYRARGGFYKNISDLFPPSYPYSQHGNRMTPAGMEKALYLSDSPDTALAEIKFKHCKATVAKVKIIRNLWALDLTLLPNIKDISCFDENYDLYSFLHSFICEISKPILKEEQEYEYVPTQIITEYFKNKLEVQGIVYPSSFKKEGKNYVFFLCEKDFVPNDKYKNIGNKYLEFYDLQVYRKWLIFLLKIYRYFCHFFHIFN